MSLSPRPNQVGSAPYAASSCLTVQLSPTRPQPRSGSAPPPRVYMTLSRSGQIFNPCNHRSSPTLTTAVTSAPTSRAYARTPSRNRAPPMPPARTTMRMSTILAHVTPPIRWVARETRLTCALSVHAPRGSS